MVQDKISPAPANAKPDEYCRISHTNSEIETEPEVEIELCKPRSRRSSPEALNSPTAETADEIVDRDALHGRYTEIGQCSLVLTSRRY
ncbi:hypothetical protein VI817_000384 [Penicillium citrinum]|nr:hypothetical protein VI817_000384 [Penicillium citrinum]